MVFEILLLDFHHLSCSLTVESGNVFIRGNEYFYHFCKLRDLFECLRK